MFEKLFWAVFFLLFIYLGGQQDSDGTPSPVITLPEPVESQLQLAEQQSMNDKPVSPSHQGTLEILPIGLTKSEQAVKRMLARGAKTGGIYTYSYTGVGEYTMSAQNLEREQRLVNSYLEGFEPFKVDNVFLPMQILARRKTYQYDHEQYKGRTEVWQTSRQAFYYTRGDCEDHALALADWLIAMGEDARVVLGTVKDGGGHAWVVLFKDGQEYLLEATQKRGLRRLRSYPLAKLETRYQPEYMFNHEYFWTNKGSKYTTDYRSSQWVQKSRLQRTI